MVKRSNKSLKKAKKVRERETERDKTNKYTNK